MTKRLSAEEKADRKWLRTYRKKKAKRAADLATGRRCLDSGDITDIALSILQQKLDFLAAHPDAPWGFHASPDADAVNGTGQPAQQE
jgi:hypothetical protein